MEEYWHVTTRLNVAEQEDGDEDQSEQAQDGDQRTVRVRLKQQKPQQSTNHQYVTKSIAHAVSYDVTTKKFQD